MKIKSLRENTGKSPNDIAKELNITIQSYYRYETGQNEPNITNLKKLADIYGVSLDYLCDHQTQNQIKIGYLNDQQRQLVELIKELNELNTIKAISYISGLIAGQ